MTIANDRRNLHDLAFPSIVREDRLADGTRWFTAEHPDLPGCMSDGSTPEAALGNLDDARMLYLETMVDNGLEIPKPR